MTLKLKQEIYLSVELEYEVIDPRGVCEVLAAWVGKVDVWPGLDAEDQAALREACEEDVRVREEEEAVERGLLAAEQHEDDEGCWKP